MDASEQLAVDLESILAKSDAKLRLWRLTVKGDIDLEWNVQGADHDWQQVRQGVRELADKSCENRANGELGMIAFLKGNTGEATRLVRARSNRRPSPVTWATNCASHALATLRAK